MVDYFRASNVETLKSKINDIKQELNLDNDAEVNEDIA